jgi:thiamine biosynthesis lipoprotein
MEHDLTFSCMGCTVRLLVGQPLRRGAASPADAAEGGRAWLRAYDARLSRFTSRSELSSLNVDPVSTVAVSTLLATAVGASVWAARQSGGLVDPTLVDELERAGYADSRAAVCSGDLLTEALRTAPPRRPAGASARSSWRKIHVDAGQGTVTRPPGVRIDSGATGKGLAADALAHRFAGYSRFAVDCAGDVRIGGPDASRRPYPVAVEHPLTCDAAHTFMVAGGGIATSGIGSRIWPTGDGGFAHHLLDPATGRPAWTGLLSATALAPTALEAETLAKVAVLAGPKRARRVLARHGGLLVRDDGDVEPIEAVAA